MIADEFLSTFSRAEATAGPTASAPSRTQLHFRHLALFGACLIAALVAITIAAQGASAASLFGSKTDFTTGTNPKSVTSDDFNGDGKPDLAVANQNSDSVSVLLGDGSGGFAAMTGFTTGTNPYSVTSDDFNGDSKADLAVANTSSNTVSVLLGEGNGGFGAKTDFATGSQPSSVTSDDFNGDGKPDLATANLASETVSILLGDGSGGFADKTDFPAGQLPESVTSDDFNGDSKADLAVTNGPPDTVSVLLGTGSGSFAAKTDFTTGFYPVSVTSDDFNGDDKPDLAVANYGSSTVSVLLGDGSPDPLAAPTSLGFSTQTPGTLSSAQTVTVSNSPVGYPLLVDQILTTGTNADDFIVSTDECSGKSVPSSGNCEVGISFGPAGSGSRTATLEISYNGGLSPLTVPLTGIGEEPPTCPEYTTGIPPNCEPVPCPEYTAGIPPNCEPIPCPSGFSGNEPDCVKLAARISKVKVSGPGKVKKGKKATYKVKIKNSGDAKATGVRLKVSGRGVSLNTSVGKISADKTRTVKVKLKPKKTGKVKLKFKVTSKNAGGKKVKKKIKVKVKK